MPNTTQLNETWLSKTNGIFNIAVNYVSQMDITSTIENSSRTTNTLKALKPHQFEEQQELTLENQS